MTKSYKELLKHINTFIFDVDGVLTNGEVMIYQGQNIRTLFAKDGYALQYATKMGYRIFIITGGNSEDVRDKLLEIGVKDVILRAGNKLDVYQKLKEKYEINDDEVLYMGDDIPDYHVMLAAQVAACPQDAVPEIKAISQYQSPYLGGKGCVRDVIEQTLKAQQKWFSAEAFTW